MKEEAVIKSIFCSYRGILIVYDIHGNKVNDLCGELTLEKHKEIERRRTDITEFDGVEDYRSIVSEKEEEEERKQQPQPVVPQAQLPTHVSQAQVSTFTVENTSKKVLPVVLFGACEHMTSTNYDFVTGITIDKPKEYGQFLAKSIVNPFIVKAIRITNADKTGGVIMINKRGASGYLSSNKLLVANNYPAQIKNTNSTTQINTSFTIDGYTDFNFDLDANSKVHIQLFH